MAERGLDKDVQGVAKPLCPPGSTSRSDDFTKYFIRN